MEFRTKAETLMALKGKLNQSMILPMHIISYENFVNNFDQEYELICKQFSGDELIIRSTSSGEDTCDESSAGKYESILNVPCNDKALVRKSIEAVFSSYESQTGQDVLLQKMVIDASISGVVFTADIDTLAPYYIINYDDTGKTDTITSGSKNSVKTYVQYKYASLEDKDQTLSVLIEAIKEIELITQNDYLDIEFAVNDKNEVIIFQVRPIVLKNKKHYANLELGNSLKKINKKIQKLMFKHPNLLGDRTVFGVMPDWNPAEIIGLRPKQLAISLYKELVTDSIWAYQRDNYGYRNLRSHPLMITFLGVPFIDVRVTFNSFIPKELEDTIAEKLANYYINQLIEKPHFHDKVEFEIVFSCYYFGVENKLNNLLDFGFASSDVEAIKSSLKDLTESIIDPVNGLYKKDIEKVAVLENKIKSTIESDLSTIDKIYWLIEDCKRYGTLPFAGIARAGFIAIQFLKSFVTEGIITNEDYHAFLNTLNTVNKQLASDCYNMSVNSFKREDFIVKYGHIRPGTYDILSPTYKDNFDNYFNLGKIDKPMNHSFEFSREQMAQINTLLRTNNMNIDAQELVSFFKEAIEGRESSKFIFTKALSIVLELIEDFGARYDIDKEELAFLDYGQIKKLYASLSHQDVYDIFMSDIVANKRMYHYTKMVKFPSVIINPEDIYAYYLLEDEPNFISQKSITAEAIAIQTDTDINLKDKIVLIESADPGYDYLFSQHIGGLITKFGGANSHMAIRCAELGIPAVIGAGEKQFESLKKYKFIEINCLYKQVKGLTI